MEIFYTGIYPGFTVCFDWGQAMKTILAVKPDVAELSAGGKFPRFVIYKDGFLVHPRQSISWTVYREADYYDLTTRYVPTLTLTKKDVTFNIECYKIVNIDDIDHSIEEWPKEIISTPSLPMLSGWID